MKGLKYNQATPTFHQWRDNKQVTQYKRLKSWPKTRVATDIRLHLLILKVLDEKIYINYSAGYPAKNDRISDKKKLTGYPGKKLPGYPAAGYSANSVSGATLHKTWALIF